MTQDEQIIQQLVSDGALSQELADHYTQERMDSTGLTPLRKLVAKKVITTKQAHQAWAHINNWDYVSLGEIEVEENIARTLRSADARRFQAVPVRFDSSDYRLVVAVENPSDLDLLADIRAAIPEYSLKLVYAPRSDIKRHSDKLYNALEDAEKVAKDFVRESHALSGAAVTSGGDLGIILSEDNSGVVEIVNLLIKNATSDRVSDIHIKPQEDGVRIRYRMDGKLREMQRLPLDTAAPLISRIKILSGLNIAEKRVPQDGRLTIPSDYKGAEDIDIRVSIMPLVYGQDRGEEAVLRVLSNSTAAQSLEQLGFSGYNLEVFQKAFKKPYGMILATGPTGSGKSTTLYATLNEVNTPEKKIITIEDPVEYQIMDISQVQVNTAQGLNFAKVLRSVLRADPDIILVGEIRDQETAKIAVEAALTGHLVFSTLHTNDAPSAITRLIEMGVEPFLAGSAVEAVLAQRLVPRLCQFCKVERYIEDEVIIASGLKPHGSHIYESTGCDECDGTGVRGRMGIHEVMNVGEKIENLAIKRASTSEIAAQARTEGMISLREDGWEKCKMGLLGFEDVLAVTIV